MNAKKNKIAIHIILILGIGITVFPFLWMILTAFKTVPESVAIPPVFFPKTWNIHGFTEIFDKLPFAKVYVNGEYLADKEWDKMKQFNSFKIGHRNDRDQIDFVGYMTSIRIYNKALNVLDVASLSTELHPAN